MRIFAGLAIINNVLNAVRKFNCWQAYVEKCSGNRIINQNPIIKPLCWNYIVPLFVAFLLIVLLSVEQAKGTTYYGKNATAPNVRTNWGTTSGGSGTNPANFTTAGDIFVIESGTTMTATAGWLIGAAGTTASTLQINSGGSLVMGGNLLTFASCNFTNSGSFSSTTGGVTITGTLVSHSIAGLTTTGTITFQKTAGTTTMNGNVSAAAFTTTTTTNNSNFNLNGYTLSLSGALTMARPSSAAVTINVGSGILNCASFSSTATTTTRATVINISTGTVTISGTTTTTVGAGGIRFTFTDAGTLNFGGSTTGGTTATITAFSGSTVNYSSTTAQTLYQSTYENLTLSGSGAKSIGTAAGGTLTSGILNIDQSGGTVTASITNTNVVVNSLQFTGIEQMAGTWGSMGATSASFKTDTWFTAASAGNLSVSNGSNPLDHFTISSISSPQTAGTAITGLTYTAQDANNNTVASYTSNVTYSGTAGITGTSAAFTYGVLSGASVTPTVAGSGLSFVITGSTKTGSSTFNVNPGVLDHFAISSISSPQVAGTAITGITLTAQDVNNNTVTSFITSVTYSGTAGITGTSASFTAGVLSGVSVTPTIAGTGMTFVVTGSTKTGSSTFNINAGAATQMAINAGNGQSATVGSLVATAPSVVVKDYYDNVVSGVAVTFAVATGGGSGTGLSATTDASGIATVGSWTLGTIPGANSMTATSAGLAGSPINFTATSTVGALDHFAISAISSPQTAGIAITGITLTAQDVYNNTVTSFGSSVTYSGTAGITGTSAVFTAGVLSGVSVTPVVAGSNRTLIVTGSTKTGTSTFNVNAGVATKASITTQPAGAVNGEAFTTQPVVQLQDANSNNVSQAGVNVVATIASGTGVLSGTTTVTTNASGVATFTNLVITGTTGNFTLTFTPAALTAATSSSFALAAGAATKGVITTQPSGAVNGVAFTTQPVVRLQDASSNNVSQAGVNVVATIASGTGVLSGTTTVTTNASGVATFTNLVITGTTGNFTLTFTPAALTAATSSSFSLATGAATKGVIVTQPSGAVNGVALTTQPVVQLQDVSNNNVSQAGINVVATIASGSGVLSGTTTVTTNASGEATFTNLVITGTAGNFTLTFTPASLTAATSSSFTLSAGAATKGTITTQPSGAVNGVIFTTQPVVRIQDSGNNNISLAGVNVVASIATGTGTLGGTTTVTTDASGIATFSDLFLTGAAGSFTLSFTPTGLTAANSNSFSLIAGTSIVSTATGGAWGTASTWIGNTIPTASQNVIIATTTGNSVTVGATLTQTGSLTINNGATLSATSNNITYGSLNILSGGTLTTSRVLTVNGATNISGTISLSGARANNFNGNVTLNSSASWTNSTTSTQTFTGNFTNNASSFNATGTGAYSFTGSGKTISGSSIIPNVAISGTISNNGFLTVGTALSGNGTLTNSASGTLHLNGTATILNLDASAHGNTVNYTGTGQSVKATIYDVLILSGSGTVTFPSGTTTVNTMLSREESAAQSITLTGTLTYGTNASLQYAGHTNQTAGAEFQTGFSATGGLIINTSDVVSLGASKILNAPLVLTNGTLSLNGFSLTLGGGAGSGGASYSCGSGTIYGNIGSLMTIGGANVNNLPEGTYQDLTINKTGTIALCGNTTINGALALTNGTFTIGDKTLTLNGPNISGTQANLVTSSASSMVFGGSAGSVAIPSVVTSLNNLTVNNSSGLLLNGPIAVEGTLTLSSGKFTIGNFDLTINHPVSGTFGNTCMIVNSGTGALIKKGNSGADFVMTYPVGTGSSYTPVQITSFSATSINPLSTIKIQSFASASSGVTGNYPLNRRWVTSSTGISGSVLVGINLTYDAASDIPPGGIASQYDILFKPSSGSWTRPNGAGAMGSNPLSASAATSIDAEWTASVPTYRSFYSLKTGSWDDPETWTLDPSGALPLNPDGLTPTSSPTAFNDFVTVLSGRTVTIPSNTKNNNNLTVIGTLDLGTTTGHSFSTISGTGKIRLAGDNFPAGSATDFISAGQGEGTVEYYGSTRSVSPPHAFYNAIVNMTTGNVLTLTSDLILNGDLTISNGTLSINNNLSTTPLNITVAGNLTVNTTGKIITGTANARHQLNLFGNFTNNGEASFTNRLAPNYLAEATDGIVDVNFLSSSANQSLFCKGITNFYRIEIDKGVDYTYTLNMDATSTSNFNLLGFANEDHSGSGSQLSSNNNAFGLIHGTVRVGNNIVIPSLSSANNYNISQGAQLWINEGTVQKNSGQTIAIFGKIRITTGLLEAKVQSGITLGLNGSLNVEGGVVNINQLRTSELGSGPNNGAFVQSGGEVNVLGGSINTDYYVFSLPNTASVFNMTGGTLKVNTASGNGSILINSDPENIKVTGGTVIAETTSLQNFTITSTSPFWNLIFKNSAGASRQFTLGAAANIGPSDINVAAKPLKILNDFRIWGSESGGVSYPSIVFDPALNDIYIGGSFYIEQGAQYVAVSGGTPNYDAIANQPTARNTTYFNKTAGTDPIEELYFGEPVNQLELGNLVIDRTSGYEVKLTSSLSRANESVAIDVNGTASVLSGIFDQNLYTLRTWGAIVNYGRMGTWIAGVTPSRAQIQMVENPSLTITTNSGAVFGNIQVNVTPPSRINLTSNVYVERMEYVKGLIYLKGFNLKIDYLWNLESGLFENSNTSSYLSVGDTGYSGNSMIFTDGNASDGGLTLKVIANSQTENEPNRLNNFGPLTFPLGFTNDGGSSLYFRPAQMVISNFADDGYATIRPVMGPLLTANASGGELLQQYWRVTADNFTTSPTVAFRFYYRNRAGGNQMDLIVANSVNEVNYVPGKVLDVNPYTRFYEPLTDNDILRPSNTRIITFNGSSTSGSFTPSSSGFTLENCNFSAGISACFAGSPTQYFSKASYGEWNVAGTWDVGSIGSGIHAVPTTGSIVHIYNDISTPSNPNTFGRISVNASGIPNVPAEINFEMPNLPLSQSTSENIPRLQFWRNGTYNLGVVKGTGMISYGNTAVVTTGDFGDFGTNPYSFYLFFAGPTSLTTIPSPIPNMMIEYSTDINQDISINYDLVLQGDALVHPLQNVNIKRDLVLGFWNGANFQFPATSGPVTVTVDRDIDFTRIPIPGSVGNRNLSVSATAGTLEHKLIVKRSIIQGSDNNFGIDLYGSAARSKAILEFQGTDNGTYTRTSTSVPNLYRIVMNKGTNQTPSFSFDNHFTLNGSSNTATKAIQMQNGSLVLNNSSINVNLTTGGSNFEIPAASCLDLKAGTAIANGTSGISLDGKLSISGGTLNMSGGNNPIEYSASGSATISVTGGALTVGGQIRRSLDSDNGVLNYAQTNGTVIVGNNAAPNGARGVLEILNPGSSFNMSGGDLYIARAQSGPTISAFYFNPDTYSIGLSANLHIGHSSTPSSQTIGIYAGKPLPKLRINNSSGQNPIAKLEVTPATITSLLTIDAGSTFNANGLNLDLKGDMTSLGTFTANNNTTYLSGTGTQTITGNGTPLNFFNLDKTGSNDVILHDLDTPLLISNELYLRSGTFTTNSNTVTVKGDMLNDAIHLYGGSGDGILLNGTSNQVLTGNGTFGKLTVNNPNGITLPVANQFKITNSLKMVSGIINIGKNMLDLGVSAAIEQASPFSLSNMISTDISFTDNGLRKKFPSGPQPDFIFPMGSANKYTPVTLSITGNGNSNGTITVKPANEIHPSIVEDTETGTQIVDANNALQYYWTLVGNGISGFTGKAKMKYISSDAAVTAPYTTADYFTASILNNGLGSWLKFPKTDFDETEKELIFYFSATDDSGISGDYTAGAGDSNLNGAIPDIVTKYETNTNGDWTSGTIWTPNVTGGPRGAIAKINQFHTVDVTTNYLAGYMTQLYGKLKINSTYGHRLGILIGTGTLYNETGDIPAAVYDNFFSSAGGTLEFGGTALDYEFLGNVMEVNHLLLSGTGERHFPNNNLILNGNLTFSGVSGLNTVNYYNRKLTVKGNIERNNESTYSAGTGSTATVSLSGTLPQTITGSFSNSNAFNNLEVNNSNDVTIQHDVEINRELILTNGLLSTAPGSLFRINYNGFVTPASGTPTSFVNGVLTKEMITGNSFMFPVGNYNSQKNPGPISLQNVTGGPAGLNDWSVSYYYSDPNLISLTTSQYVAPITAVSNSEYWKIQTPIGGQAVISIVLDGSSDVGGNITDINNLRIVGWNPSISKWEIVGTSSVISGSNTNGTITTTSTVNFNNYTYFTIASTTSLSVSSASFTSPATVNICSGTSTTLVVAMSGTQPWVLTYQKGSTTVVASGLTSSPYYITEIPSATTVYTLTGITANGIPGTINGVTQVTVNVNPKPTGTLISNAVNNTICQNGGITFTATAGFVNYNFRVDGNTVQNGSGNTYTTSSLAPGSHSVEVIATNAGACTNTFPALAVTVNPYPVAAGPISGSASVCKSSSATYTVPAIANATSYVWTSSNGATGSSTTNSITLNFPTSGTSVLTVKGRNSCGDGATSTFSVLVNNSSSAGAAGAITGPSEFCKGGTGYSFTVAPVSNATSYIWAYSGAGATINGAGNTVTIDFSAGATSGNLTVAGTNGCNTGTVSPNFPITANSVPTATIAPSSPSTCSGSSLLLTATPNGGTTPYTLHSWTGTGASSLTSTSITNPSFTNSTGGIYDLTYSVTDTKGCIGSVTTNVQVFQAPVAYAGTAINNCTGSAPVTMTGATASGTFTGTPTWTGAGGTWTQNPDPALATFTPSTSYGTTTATLTLTGSNGCGNATSTRTITWNSVPVQPGTITGSTVQCPVTPNQTYSIASVPNSNSYIWTVPSGWIINSGQGTNSILVTSGSTGQNGNITVLASNACGSGTSQTLAVTITPASVGGTVASAQTICSGSAPSNLTLSGQTGSVLKWQKSSDALFTSPTDIAVASTTLSGATIGSLTSSTYFRAQVQSGSCSTAYSSSVLITVTPTVTINAFSPATSTRCQGAGTVSTTTTANNSTGITYSLDATTAAFPGNSIVAATGAVTYAAGWSGTTTITASAAGCNGPATTTHVVTITPTVTINAFSPATSTRCQGAGTVTTTTTANNSTGITYSLDATTAAFPGNSIFAATGAVTYAAGWSGTTTITASAAGCNGPATTTHVVTISPTVTINAFSPATSTRCQGAGTVTTTTTATNSTGITYSLDATTAAFPGNSIVAATGAVTYAAGWSGTTTITASAAGCNGPATTTHVVTITPTVTINAFSPATSTRCQGAGTVTTTTTANNSTGITYSLDATTAAFPGNSIVAATGAVTYAAGWSGTTTITASAAGCNGPATTTHVVTITPTVTINAFSPATSTRCQGAGTVTTTTTANNSTGITYSLDATTAAFPGNSIVAATGAVTYAAGWSGTTTITASAAGCNGPATTTHVVTTHLPASANAGTPISMCSNAGGVNITSGSSAANYTAITWSSSGTGSLSNANSLTTCVYTPSGADIAMGSVTLTLTATGNAPCGNATSTKSLTIRQDGAWLGGGSDWNTAANWDCNTIPSLTSDVVIANGKTPYPILSGTPVGTTRNLTIGSSATVTVTGANAQLKIAGNINISSSGPINASAGTIEMAGSSAQTIPANTFTGNNLKDLIISNSAGVTLGGTLNLTGVLTASTGNLASAGYLTLVSSPTQTALIDGTGNGQVTGTVAMQRYLASGKGYKYFSSPFSDATVAQFSGYLSTTVSIPKFYSYDENHKNLGVDMTGWTSYPAGTLNPMEGYSANLGPNAAPNTISLNGTVNNGNYSATLFNHNQTYTKGFNLVGNPYPSPIDWNAVSGWTKTNIDNAIYFFDASSGADEYSGVYSSYVGGVSTGGSTNLIPSMQGFFVHVTDGGYPVTGTLGMSNPVRTNDLITTFKAAQIDSRPILRFVASFDEKNSVYDPFVLYFDRHTTPNFDKELDALKMMNTDVSVPNIYALTPEFRKLSIDGRPEPSDSTTRIPLGINILKNGWLNILAKDITGLPNDLNLYLLDKEKNITQNLRNNSSYRYYAQTGENNQRFELLFVKSTDPILPTLSDNLFAITQLNGSVMVKVNLPDNNPGTLFVTNMTGQTMIEKEVSNLQTVDISAGVNSGVYIVTIISGDRKQSEKTLIRKK